MSGYPTTTFYSTMIIMSILHDHGVHRTMEAQDAGELQACVISLYCTMVYKCDYAHVKKIEIIKYCLLVYSTYNSSRLPSSSSTGVPVCDTRTYSPTPHTRRHRHPPVRTRRDARTHPLIEADEPEYRGGRNGRCRPVRVARLVAN